MSGQKTKQKHTPGPWAFAWGRRQVLVFDAKGGPTIVGVPYDGEADAQLAASNARLIAAAPELLEACKNLLGYGENWPASFTSHDCWKRDAASARAAIAKATGEQP